MLKILGPVALIAMLTAGKGAHATERAIIVFDGSGSMWSQIDGKPKLEIARQALRDMLETVPDTMELGLMAYGHREKGNCNDIETLVAPAANTKGAIMQAVQNMRFLGKTPLSAAVQQAATELRHTENKATVIIEYLVRVANVARNAVDTEPAEFTLKVEVEGFYGEDVSSGSLPGAIPPGFAITGPDPKWSCFGDDDARATYAFMTPEGVASQLERMLPQGLKNVEDDLDQAEMQAQKYSDAELQRIQKRRRRFETSFDASVDASDAEHKVARAAAEIRLKTESQIMVKLNGRNAAGTCDVLLVLTVPGEPAPQRVPPDNYSVNITPQSGADAMATAADFARRLDFSAMQTMSVEQLQSLSEQFQTAMQDYDSTEPDWLRCTTNMRDCEDGEFHLGEASYQHLFGTFSFQVYKGDLELVPGTAEHPREYAEVSGHINITSTQEDVDNHLLDFLSRPSGPGDMLQIPNLEAFMQGGSMFGK